MPPGYPTRASRIHVGDHTRFQCVFGLILFSAFARAGELGAVIRMEMPMPGESLSRRIATEARRIEGQMFMTQQPPDQNTILVRYAEGPAQLEAALEGLAEEDLDVALSADTWTIRQIVHHIVDGDDLWKACIKIALGNSGTTFDLQWYWDLPQDRWVQRWDYAGRAIEPSLALFRANRSHVAQLLQQITDGWERYVLIKWPGRQEEERITVGDVVEMQANHLLGHVDDIRLIREARGLGAPESGAMRREL